MSDKDNLFEEEERLTANAINEANSSVTKEYGDSEKMKQGSKAWFKIRTGKFTGSTYPDLMKKGRTKNDDWGLTALNIVKRVYLERDLTDIGMIAYIDSMFNKEFYQTKWGNDYEPDARNKYMEVSGNNVEETCFKVHDKMPFMGGSFDGVIIGQPKIIEIKCPYDMLVHASNCELSEITEKHKYYGQIQGNIEIAGADECDFISFDPRRKTRNLKIITVKRDQDYIDRLIRRILVGEKAIEYMNMDIDVLGAILLAEKEY